MYISFDDLQHLHRPPTWPPSPWLVVLTLYSQAVGTNIQPKQLAIKLTAPSTGLRLKIKRCANRATSTRQGPFKSQLLATWGAVGIHVARWRTDLLYCSAIIESRTYGNGPPRRARRQVLILLKKEWLQCKSNMAKVSVSMCKK
jgi:hypothetical protein